MLELFHRIADPGSAQVRKLLSDRDLLRQVRLRNLHYAEVEADFAARGGQVAPALWDGERLYEGVEPVLARLRLLGPGR
jgi:hypothetical protein